MLKLELVIEEGFDDVKSEFVPIQSKEIELEHSLVSLSKWESKWELPFLGASEKTNDMLADYIRMMVLTPIDYDPMDYLSPEQVNEINEYINSKQTATWFAEDNKPGRRGAANSKVTTSELLYYYMVALTIPFECQHWHLNRLLTLIRITDLENKPKKNQSRRDTVNQHRSLNQARRAAREGGQNG